MSTVGDHNLAVRNAFTQQARTYAATPSIADPGRIARLVGAVKPRREQRVLDVATGPGFVAMALASRVAMAVGIDLTEAPLAIAEQLRQEMGVANLHFQPADARNLPFATEAFDVVVCRFAFHHFPDPDRVLHEMARVCRRGGTIAVEDLVASEHPERAAYQNRFENIRDPSHVAALPLSGLLALFAAAGLEMQQVVTDQLTPVVERWFSTAQTPPDRAAEARRLIEEDELHNLSGTQPFRNAANELCFVQRTAIVVGRTLHS